MSVGKSLALQAARLISYRGIGIGRLAVLGLAGLEYLTVPKVLNGLRCELEKARRVAKPAAYPYVAVLDVTNECNLRCPYCPTGLRMDSGRDRTLMDPSMVRRLVAEVGRYLVSCNFYNWGEPLLHPKIAELVEICHEARIWTVISTNLNTKNKRLLEDLCDAGLDYLVLSLDGATQESYEKYRNGGDFGLALENLAHIMEYRRRKKLKNPIVDWKFLVFKHNRHETRQAYDIARELGVDIFRYRQGGGPNHATVEASATESIKKRVIKQYCRQLWHVVVVNSDGGIAPCCYVFNKKDDFGEYDDSGLMRVRNNESFVTARKLFDPAALAELPPSLEHTCLKCDLIHSQKHLREYLAANPYAKPDHRSGISYDVPESAAPLKD